MRRYLLLVLIATGCADLTRYDADVCGNNVVESDEDCDLIVDASLGADLSCGPPDGTPRACRYLCTKDTSCPDGWSCFDDGICRYPSGGFSADDEPRLVLRADEIGLADVLGDERVELVTRLQGDLAFYDLEQDEEAADPVRLALPTVRGEMVLAPLTDGGRAGVFFPASSQFESASGQPIVHALKGSRDRLVTISAPRESLEMPGEVVSAAAIRQLDGLDDLLVVGQTDDDVVVRVRGCPNDLATITGRTRPTTPRFADDGGQRLMALGFIGANAATVLVQTSSAACAPFTVVADLVLPGVLSDAGVDLFDLDGDGTLDLLAYLEDERIGVASGDATGFGPVAVSDALVDLDQRLENQPTFCGGERFVLAAGLINDDARVDFVTEDSIFLAAADGSGYIRAFSRTRQDAWAEAVIGDFDRDGKVDVVASTRSRGADCSTIDVELVRQVEGESFASTPVNAVTRPRDLLVGDFDADGIDDVAMLEQSLDEAFSVAILYGDSKEALEDKTSVARFEEVEFMSAFVGRTTLDLNDDRASDLAIFLPGGEVATLLGSTRRAVLAPIPFMPIGADVGLEPFAMAMGHFLDRESDLLDMFVLGSDASWLLPNDGLLDVAGTVRRPSAAPLDALNSRCTQLVTVEADDAFDGVVGIDGRFFENEGLLSPANAGDCDYFGAASTMAFATIDTNGEATGYATSVGDTSRVPVEIEAADFDDDGLADVAIRFAYEGTERRGSVIVIFDVANEGGARVSVLADRDVVGIAPIDADADATKELAVFTSSGLFVVDFEETTPTVRSVSSVGAPDFDLDDGPTRLSAADVDGDRLEDLVLLYGQAVYVYVAEVNR